jgi:hypothetical protein
MKKRQFVVFIDDMDGDIYPDSKTTMHGVARAIDNGAKEVIISQWPSADHNPWRTMDSAPKEERILLAYKTDQGFIDYNVGMWVENYGCPGWRAAGTFVTPLLWMPIHLLSDESIQ